MRLLIFLIMKICTLSVTWPRLIIVIFLSLAVAGFSAMPMIKLSTNLIEGLGDSKSVIRLTQENNEVFGEQDSLILVLEFPEPPGEDRLPFIKGLGESLADLPEIRRVRYRFLDPEDYDQIAILFKHFLLGMNPREREQIGTILSPQGIQDALRRTRNRVFLSEHPYIQKRLLEDPLELGRFVSESVTKRVGSVSLGDIYLLIASPDSTVYLIQITPDFPSTDILKGVTLIDRMRDAIPEKISELKGSLPGGNEKWGDLKWYLTGKTAFHYESDKIFDRETLVILVFSFSMVSLLLFSVYRSFWSAVILMTPIVAGIGPNYGLIYLGYEEVNPVVMGASGVLFGLGVDYGVHLWGRFREEVDRGATPLDALHVVYERTGPPVMLGGLTAILSFLCLCLSDQQAMAQFGWVGASGLVLTLCSTLFLFPALVTLIAARKRDYFPRMRVSFKVFSRLYKRGPGVIIIVSGLVLLLSLLSTTRVSYEKDLFKVFLARDMESMDVSKMISRKFHANFAQPTLLSFEVDDLQEGLAFQRGLDEVLENLMERDHEIASIDSISYLMSPDRVREANVAFFGDVASRWHKLDREFSEELVRSDFSEKARKTARKSFDATKRVFGELAGPGTVEIDELTRLERSWYQTRIDGKYRFLTQIRYSDQVADMAELRKADRKLMDAVQNLPITVNISGPRQAMEAILSGLVSELVRLGLVVLLSVVAFFFILFRHPLSVFLSLIPMTGAFCITLGVTGALGLGLPFSIVGVAPLIFGLGMDNGVHVVMGSSSATGGSVDEAMSRVTRPIIFTSLANVTGFVAMLTSQHYSLEFLGWAMVIGMAAAVALTLTTLPAILLLIERRRAHGGRGFSK
ncbi:MAG: efflux RND transporter permease subunit [Desulfomonilaceae bacterium]|nr:efflux RND transporter permease subunit [Desulfomonilaceae bacterium]